jgi:hypothetical protein
MKTTTYQTLFEKGGGKKGGMEVQWDKSVQGTLYVCLELSQ